MTKQAKPSKASKASKPSKASKDIDDYIIVKLPENPYIFGVQRNALPEERCIASTPNHAENIKEVYDSVMHIVSPFVNYYTGEKTESCSCISWRTRKKRCIHLKAFYKKNPEMDKTANMNENSKDLKELRKIFESKSLVIGKDLEDNTSIEIPVKTPHKSPTEHTAQSPTEYPETPTESPRLIA